MKKIPSPKQKTQPKKMKLKSDWKKSMGGQRNIKEAFRNFTENRDIITKNDEMNDNNEDKILMRKNNDSNKESRVYIFGKESGISSEENMEASSQLRDIGPLGTNLRQMKEPVDEVKEDNADKTRKDEFQGRSTKRNVNEIGMRIQDESSEKKSTNPQHELMVYAIFQVREQNKINNLLNFWEDWGLKGEFHKVKNLLGKQTNKTKSNKDKLLGIKNQRKNQEHH